MKKRSSASPSDRQFWNRPGLDVCEHGELANRNPAAYAVIEAARQCPVAALLPGEAAEIASIYARLSEDDQVTLRRVAEALAGEADG